MQLGVPRTACAGGVSLVACAALVVSGCSMGDDVMATIGMSPPETTAVAASVQTLAPPQAPEAGENPELVVTPAQRTYLDALSQAGVQPASDMSALSIGSYVCQARAANQSDQAVWDFVLPLVRGDVRDSHIDAVTPPVGRINAVTADYIRIATDKLC